MPSTRPAAGAVDAEIRIKGEVLPYVSRGGLKLKKALDEFGIDVRVWWHSMWAPPPAVSPIACCSPARPRVFAVDVGYGQLAWKLQQDPRVVSMEKTNIRYLTPDSSTTGLNWR